MLDTKHGRIACSLLGGVLDIGDKLLAIPWQALNLNNDEKRFYLNADKEMLETAVSHCQPKIENGRYRAGMLKYGRAANNTWPSAHYQISVSL